MNPIEPPSIHVLPHEFTIHRCSPDGPVPVEVYGSDFYWIGKTDEELSIVCEASLKVRSVKHSDGWSCLRLKGPLDLGSIGVLAAITDALASARIGVFALSTFDTDYILVKTADLPNATRALMKSGHDFEPPLPPNR